jgi:flagellar basal body rod protein FlgB
MSWLVDPAQRVLSTALDGYARREQAVAANLANIDTPGYRAASVDFEGELAAALEAGSGAGPLAMNPPSHGPSAALEMRQVAPGQLRGAPGQLSGAETGSARPGSIGVQTQAEGVRTRLDGNGVDLETEMTALAETQLKYSAVSRLLTGKLGMLRDVVTSR